MVVSAKFPVSPVVINPEADKFSVAPDGPVGPVGPVGPAGPVGPVAPVAPLAP